MIAWLFAYFITPINGNQQIGPIKDLAYILAGVGGRGKIYFKFVDDKNPY